MLFPSLIYFFFEKKKAKKAKTCVFSVSKLETSSRRVGVGGVSEWPTFQNRFWIRWKK